MSSTTGSLQYFKWQDINNYQKPYEVFFPLASFGDENRNVQRTNLAFEIKDVAVRDARGDEARYCLDIHGFAFAQHSTSVHDLKDRGAVEKHYLPEMEEFLKAYLGNHKAKTYIFETRIRESMDPQEFAKRVINLEDGFDPLLPATHPHIDQTAAAAIKRVRHHMGDEAERLLQGRVRILNIWRPLRKVTSWPLAVCDARSVDVQDLVSVDIIRRKYIGETCFSKHNPDQEWYYLSDQNTNEIILLKIYDSSNDVEAKFCLHSAFSLEKSEKQESRQSIEIRVLVFTDY
ncbi:hypothetical protein BX600DRAFT_145551 [Xylariales sp. PMI_506]|nr:hypothetical protein BX600DRAFT_145551 [Xylariales sp. PMI_506]